MASTSNQETFRAEGLGGRLVMDVLRQASQGQAGACVRGYVCLVVGCLCDSACAGVCGRLATGLVLLLQCSNTHFAWHNIYCTISLG